MRSAGANGLVWDEDALEKFLKDPQQHMPGTAMRFWGLWKWERDDLIAFLKTSEASMPHGNH
jgi:cytochrome c